MDGVFDQRAGRFRNWGATNSLEIMLWYTTLISYLPGLGKKPLTGSRSDVPYKNPLLSGIRIDVSSDLGAGIIASLKGCAGRKWPLSSLMMSFKPPESPVQNILRSM